MQFKVVNRFGDTNCKSFSSVTRRNAYNSGELNLSNTNCISFQSVECSKSAISTPLISRAQSTPREKRTVGNLNRETHVPGIGIATQVNQQ